MKKTIARLLVLSLTITAAAGLSVSASEDVDNVIIVAASATPHAEILEAAREALEEEGWELDVRIFSDYVEPNLVVDEGDILANYFQHITYLNEFNEERGTNLVSVAEIHYEPFGIYPGTKSSLDELEDGDVIMVPNDTTNEARALLLLEANGIITLDEGAGLTATKNDIVSKSVEVEIEEVEAAQVAQYTSEAALVVLNGNYALEAGLSVSEDAIAYESADSETAAAYVNVIAVAEGNEDDAGVQALIKVLQSDEIKDFINETYDGAVLPYEASADEAEEAETEAVTE